MPCLQTNHSDLEVTLVISSTLFTDLECVRDFKKALQLPVDEGIGSQHEENALGPTLSRIKKGNSEGHDTLDVSLQHCLPRIKICVRFAFYDTRNSGLVRFANEVDGDNK